MKELAEESPFPVQVPCVNHSLRIFPREVFGAHRPKGCGHEHAVSWTHEEDFVSVGLPPLFKHKFNVLLVLPDKISPMIDI